MQKNEFFSRKRGEVGREMEKSVQILYFAARGSGRGWKRGENWKKKKKSNVLLREITAPSPAQRDAGDGE